VTVQQMLGAHPQPTSLNRDALLRCIDECFGCAATCTRCADACLVEQDVQVLVRCVRLNLDCADGCDAAGRILTRQTAPDVGVLRAAIQACAAACRAHVARSASGTPSTTSTAASAPKPAAAASRHATTYSRRSVNQTQQLAASAIGRWLRKFA
jgi:hypothetical protein